MDLKGYLLNWDKEEPIGLPNVIDAEDFNNSQLLIDGQWHNRWYSCGVIQKDGFIYYFETDDDRGYIRVTKKFDNEEDFMKYIDHSFSITARAAKSNAMGENTPEAMVRRFLMKKTDLTEEKARKLAKKFNAHEDLFDELFNYMRVGRMTRMKTDEPVIIAGCTTEMLVNEKGLDPIEAYKIMLRLADCRMMHFGTIQQRKILKELGSTKK